MGEVGGGPLKNRGGRKAALERGWWRQGLTARPAILPRSHQSGAERGERRGANSTRQRGGVGEVGEVRGDFNQLFAQREVSQGRVEAFTTAMG